MLSKLHYGFAWRLLTAIIVLSYLPVAAEELLLKNGQKVVGTIVGFENGMFRVETDYGVALVRKDKVASVSFEAGGAKPPSSTQENKTKSEPAASPPARAKESPLSATDSATPKPKEPLPPPPQSVPVAKPIATSSTKVTPAPPAPPVSRPLDEPLPTPIEEYVEGNNYTNDTFHFTMYKPPGWIIHERPRQSSSAIVAIGTEDEQTLLIVERVVWSGTPDLKQSRMEATLRGVYQEYQPLAETPGQVEGLPAIRREFKGVMDGAEWHGVSAHLAREKTVFSIVGMTSAETFEFKKAILNKIINSFRFLPPGQPHKTGTASSTP